jgi:hypothetical protein
VDTVAVQNPEPAAVQATAPSIEDGAHRFRFEDMRLAVGDKLQLSPPSTVSGNRSVVPLIGYVEGVTLIVGAPPAGQWRPSLIEGDQITVRVFGGQNAFGFTVYVDKIIRQPFDYLHLSFPKDIVGKIIRNSRRIKTHIAVVVADNPAPATISNLSATGAEVRAGANLGEPGAKLALSFTLNIFGTDTQLSPQAVIRTVKQDPQDGIFRCGVEFNDLRPNDVTALHGLIYQELVEHPHNLV